MTIMYYTYTYTYTYTYLELLYKKLINKNTQFIIRGWNNEKLFTKNQVIKVEVKLNTIHVQWWLLTRYGWK